MEVSTRALKDFVFSFRVTAAELATLDRLKVRMGACSRGAVVRWLLAHADLSGAPDLVLRRQRVTVLHGGKL